VTASLLRKKRPRCVDEIQHEVGTSSSSTGGEVELGPATSLAARQPPSTPARIEVDGEAAAAARAPLLLGPVRSIVEKADPASM
jgi:hypothetical protein